MAGLTERLESFRKEHPGLVTGAALLRGVAAANHLGGEIIWESGPNVVVPRPYNGSNKSTIGVVFPGLGSLMGNSMAQQMEQTPLGNQKWFYCQYDNKKGANNKHLAEQLSSWQQQLGFEGMDAYDPSMGIIHNLEVARLSGVPLHNVLLTGSPSHVRDARAGWLGLMIAKHYPYDGGLGAKFTSTLIANTARYGLKETRSNFTNAAAETLRGASIKLLRTQMKELGSKELLRDWRDYERVIIPGYTRIAYAASLDDSDRVVYTAQAYPNIVKFFNRFGIDVPFIELPAGAGHANTPLTLEAAKPWMEKINQRTESVLFEI